ncbi:MAG TPA: hypothetical protein VLN58_16190 [Verrucomicrobiae bacterium]|nr:hypothetical protein [Verrucomicrobiae bacterium]
MMENEQTRKAKKLLEQAQDRERMARIVKRHEKPAQKKTTAEKGSNQAAAPAVREGVEH